MNSQSSTLSNQERLEQFLSKLNNLKNTSSNEWSAACPAHEDKTASLSVSISSDGVILAHCHAGCDFKSIIAAMGIEAKMCFPLKAIEGGKSSGGGNKSGYNRKIVARYDYRDENGDLLYQKIRYEPKEFRIRKSDGAGGWSWSLGKCRRVLYRLPELIAAIKRGDPVLIVEGEKDVDNLALWGLVATTNYDGAGKWLEQYNGYFKGAVVINLRDNDPPGEKHGNLIGENLFTPGCEIAALYCSILLPGLEEEEHGDVTDWAEKHGGTKEKLLEIIAAAPRWTPPENGRANQQNKIALLSDFINDLPLAKLKKPPLWNVDKENGVWIETPREGHVTACPVPVILHRRLRNIDTFTERVEICFWRDGQWRSVATNYSTVFEHRSIISLGEKGLPVSSASSKYLVQYLTRLQESNLDVIPTVNSVSRMGWAGEKIFLPGAENDIVLDSPDYKPTEYCSCGDYGLWKELTTKIRNESALGRLTIAAGFAAPLLKLLNQRVFVIHLWGPTKGGKTAVMKAALSIWGDPDELMANFNATKVGLERLANYHCDLPLGIDERQVAGNKQEFIEGLVYLLSLGKGKTRGAKEGGRQVTSSWRTIAITNGEESLSSESSTGGINTRVMELYGQPLSDIDFARSLHFQFANNYGYAGQEYIKKLIEYDKSDLRCKYESVINRLVKENPQNVSSHLPALATIMIADYLVGMWIYGLEEEESLRQSIEMSKEIVGQLTTAIEADDSVRAYDYLVSQFQSNYARFTDGSYTDVRYGFHDAVFIYFYPHIFSKIMEEGKFNPQRALRDWSEQNIIDTCVIGNDKKKRFKIRKKDPYTQTQTFFVAVRKPSSNEQNALVS
jgi:putative DNA primase/helicase